MGLMKPFLFISFCLSLHLVLFVYISEINEPRFSIQITNLFPLLEMPWCFVCGICMSRSTELVICVIVFSCWLDCVRVCL